MSEPTPTPSATAGGQRSKALLSVVVPAFDEQAVLPEFHARLAAVFDRLVDLDCEVIYVNDGSRDRTRAVIGELARVDRRVAFVDLSRNFGKEIAMTAGFDYARGDAVVVIDADLQDPPELIVDMVREWRAGFDVVYARRSTREGETWLKKATAAAFYRLIRRVSRVDIPADTGDYRLMSRRACDALARLREQHRFMKGLFAWIGFPAKAIDYRRDPRRAGSTKFNYWKLWNFALEGVTGFTIAPLKIATYLGLATAAFAFLFLALVIFRTLVFGDPVRGYPTIMVTILFLGGTQLFFIGLIGEYVGRIFNETKGRPLYIIQEYHASAIDLPDGAEDPVRQGTLPRGTL